MFLVAVLVGIGVFYFVEFLNCVIVVLKAVWVVSLWVLAFLFVLLYLVCVEFGVHVFMLCS